MKKFLLIITAAVLLFSCSKKKNDSPAGGGGGKITGNIVATWYYWHDTTQQVSNGKVTSTTYNQSNNPGTTMQFKSDGTGVITVPSTPGFSGYTQTFKYTIKNGVLTEVRDGYSLGLIDLPGVTLSSTIKTLSSTELVLYYDLSNDPENPNSTDRESIHEYWTSQKPS